MAASVVLSLLLLCLVCPGSVSGARWSPGLQQSAVFFVCAEGTLFLPWTLELADGETIVDIQWLYSGRSDVLISILVRGNFVPMAGFSGRVHQTTNTGISIVQLGIMDSGNYSVEAIVRTAGGDMATLRRSASVHVSEGLHTVDGNVSGQLQPVAEQNETTGEIHVVLACGTFMYSNQPPIEVTWMTPSGQRLPSSGYKDGQFMLMLPNPVELGSYTCHVPTTTTCLQNNTMVATVQVERTEARLAVLGGQNNALKAALDSQNAWRTAVRNENNALRGDLERLKSQVELQKNSSADNLKRVTFSLQNQIDTVEREATSLRNRLHTQVSFHARASGDVHVPVSESPLILSNVVTNQGQAYDPTTGAFTAPVNGTYCFMASTTTASYPAHANMFLMVDDAEVDFLYAFRDDGTGGAVNSGAVHAVVHLGQGQRVWLKGEVDGHYFGVSTAFSGFLVSLDDD